MLDSSNLQHQKIRMSLVEPQVRQTYTAYVVMEYILWKADIVVSYFCLVIEGIL